MDMRSIRARWRAVALFSGLFVGVSVFGFVTASAPDEWSEVTPPGTSAYEFRAIAAMGGTVFVGTDHGVYKSSDDGETWTAMNTGLTNTSVNALAIGWTYDSGSLNYVANSSSPVFAATDGGIFKTTLGGSSWSAANTGLTDTQTRDIEIDQYQATQGSFSTLYAATPTGVFRSEDLGDTWTLQNTGMTGISVDRLASDYLNGLLFAVSSGAGVYSSPLSSFSASDESWTLVSNLGGASAADIALIQAQGGMVWVGTDQGIFKGESDGASLAATNSGLPSSRSVTSVASDFLNSNIAYVGLASGGVYRTTCEANTGACATDADVPGWVPIHKDLTDLEISAVATDPSDPLIVYAAGASGVYRLSLSEAYIDLTPPSAITDLAAVPTGSTENFTVSWTAPGDDGTYGYPSSYEVRYSTSLITEGNWSSATLAAGEPAPAEHLRAESFVLQPETAGVSLYIAAKSFDEDGNESSLSNVALVDIIDPTEPAAFVGAAASAESVNLSWTASTDDIGVIGYAISRNGTHIATSTGLSYTDSGLTAATAYTYSIRAYDAAYNGSDLVSVSVTTSAASGGDGGGGDEEEEEPPQDTGGGGGSSRRRSRGGGTTIIPPSYTLIPLAQPFLAAGTTGAAAGSASALPVSGWLYLGVTDPEVMKLQRVLNAGGYTVAVAGAGSSGNENSRFGELTLRALQRFQCARLSVCSGTPATTGYGATGPKTRAALAALAGGSVAPSTFAQAAPAQVATVQAQSPTPSVTHAGASIPLDASITTWLYLGTVHPQVKTLQQILNASGYAVASSGIGSNGFETERFGDRTNVALKRFQCDRLKLCSGDPESTGYGATGPKTRAALNAQLASLRGGVALGR